MKRKLIVLLFACCMMINSVNLYAEGDLTTQKAISQTVYLGNKSNAMRFYPAHLKFETGKLYKLVLHNPGTLKHYFTAEAFSRSIFTRKVEIKNKSNVTISEVKGVINEIEVYPGGTAEWWFVPIKTLQAARLYCSINGHAEAGMHGSISID